MNLTILPQEIRAFIPRQRIGVSRDAQGCSAIVSDYYFDAIKANLLNVNNWSTYTGITKTYFTLFDQQGVEAFRAPLVKDLIRIEFPIISPNKQLSPLYDWVEIKDFQQIRTEYYQAVIMQLCPTKCPTIGSQCANHFFTDDASNTFILIQTADLLSLSIHGRNEFPNIFIESKLKAFRNLMIAGLGFVGASKHLWENIARGIVKNVP